MNPLPRQSGFTLIELMVTATVLAVLAMVALPNLQGLIASNRLTAVANETLVGLQLARMEAVRRNARTVFCPADVSNPSAPICASGDAAGWIVFADKDKNSAFGTGDVLLRSGTFGQNLRLLRSSNFPAALVYGSDGFARQGGALVNGALDVCLATTATPENRRRLILRSGGAASVTRAGTAGSCTAIPTDSP